MWDKDKKKKVLVINGSPKLNRSTTMSITNAFIEGLNEFNECDVEIINVQSLNFKPCTGCLSCWGRTEGECVIKNDDISVVKEKILNADIIIESFPLFFFGMPGILKLFTDRLLSMMNTYRGHKPPEGNESFHGLRYPDANKRFVVISSCAYTEVDTSAKITVAAPRLAASSPMHPDPAKRSANVFPAMEPMLSKNARRARTEVGRTPFPSGRSPSFSPSALPAVISMFRLPCCRGRRRMSDPRRFRFV